MTRVPGSQFHMPLIERRQRISDDSPPWLGMAFSLPVDSDELYEELKRIYPDRTTLRQRKHMAAIDFLKAELELMMKRPPSLVPVENVYTSFPESPRSCLNAYIDQEQDSSRYQSPKSVSQERMSVEYDSHQADKPLTRGSSAPTAPTTSEQAQQFVFSIVDGRPQQPKTKKRMSKEEKAAYRKTRKHGACLRCRRQKSKCNHVINGTKAHMSPIMSTLADKRRHSLGPANESGHTHEPLASTDNTDLLSPNSRTTSPPRPSVVGTAIAHSYSAPTDKDTLVLRSRDQGTEEGAQSEVPRSPSSSSDSDGGTSPPSAHDFPMSTHTFTTINTTPETPI